MLKGLGLTDITKSLSILIGVPKAMWAAYQAW